MPISTSLASLAMHRVMLAPLAVLLELEALGIILLVLRGRVVTALAIRARHRDQRSHEYSFYAILSQACDYTHESE